MPFGGGSGWAGRAGTRGGSVLKLDDDVDGPVGGEVGEVRGELPGWGEERDDGGE
jgi:hypothetical protein